MNHVVKIISTGYVTHNVKRFVFEKPAGFKFTPGQATDVSVNKKGWDRKKNPFTFTCLNSDDYLEFTIKIYPPTGEHAEGVTNCLGGLHAGDELIIRDAWGAIEYKGPGYFIAGGAGITPFIAILRQLYTDGGLQGNTLFFSNNTNADIIYGGELKKMLGDHAVFTTTGQKGDGDHRRIDAAFLKTEVKDTNKHFYVCGPDQMVKDISGILEKMGAKADALVLEK